MAKSYWKGCFSFVSMNESLNGPVRQEWEEKKKRNKGDILFFRSLRNQNEVIFSRRFFSTGRMKSENNVEFFVFDWISAINVISLRRFDLMLYFSFLETYVFNDEKIKTSGRFTHYIHVHIHTRLLFMWEIISVILMVYNRFGHCRIYVYAHFAADFVSVKFDWNDWMRIEQTQRIVIESYIRAYINEVAWEYVFVCSWMSQARIPYLIDFISVHLSLIWKLEKIKKTFSMEKRKKFLSGFRFLCCTNVAICVVSRGFFYFRFSSVLFVCFFDFVGYLFFSYTNLSKQELFSWYGSDRQLEYMTDFKKNIKSSQNKWNIYLNFVHYCCCCCHVMQVVVDSIFPSHLIINVLLCTATLFFFTLSSECCKN